jgi:hypothetical protein
MHERTDRHVGDETEDGERKILEARETEGGMTRLAEAASAGALSALKKPMISTQAFISERLR